jgi:hypothetical protein
VGNLVGTDMRAATAQHGPDVRLPADTDDGEGPERSPIQTGTRRAVPRQRRPIRAVHLTLGGTFVAAMEPKRDQQTCVERRVGQLGAVQDDDAGVERD